MARGGKDTIIIGANGERNAAIRLTQGQLFDVIELGGNTPAFDLICRINDSSKPYHFLVQVKATETKIFTTTTPKRIKTPVPQIKYKPLQLRPVPTYIAGVNNLNGDVYIAPAFEPVNKYGGSVPTTYILSQGEKKESLRNLELLKQDVIDYWEGLNIQTYKSSFKSALK